MLLNDDRPAGLQTALVSRYAPAKVYLALMEMDKQAPGAFTTALHIVDYTGVPIKQVQSILQRMVKERLLERLIRVGVQTRYRLTYEGHMRYITLEAQ